MDKLVIIPTYNEKENIENIIRKVCSLEGNFHILIVDDGSPDGTAAIVKSLQTEFSDRLHIAERSGKQGLGTAYIFGFKWALGKGYQYIFEMDADFSHNPDDLIRLYDACKNGADVSVGSRYTSGGKIKNWPFDRIFISFGASVYVRMITWMPVKDCTAGFVCYKREVLEKLPLDKVQFIGYAFQIEMKYRAWKLGFKIKEVPITFVDRKEGVSKMSKGIVKEAIFGVWKMRSFSN
ncbi:polyprenol monophosphomannose synthase [Taibaiella lutea]|uniref:Polyprenol monophosphomannose synthase n=1 Tax=Taibaiella lutea TaxID=2608001 RepID=A0A5M6CPK2_9BACT|nr:polyprenol monophosphomannose synthase [Taibaiella lutea]KAA5535059.1 polyprenol monophosphomannose synthase [Taibaiella lutea]